SRLGRGLGGFVPGAGAAQAPVSYAGLRVVDRRFVAHAHRIGMHVHVWTVDDPDEMHRLLDLGVDGIMTDRIDVLADVYRDRGHWPT
ncbi:MAG: glycerophosphodiester phosphodiesterase family protein, partial [Stackebrandtia sp.]